MFSTSVTALIQIVLCMTGVMTLGLIIAGIFYAQLKRDEADMLLLAEYDTAGDEITTSK